MIPALSLLLSVIPSALHAKPAAAPAADAPSADAPAADAPSADTAPAYHWQPGPRTIALGHDLTMQLPGGDIYLPSPEAAALLKKLGNLHNDNLLGIVASKDDAQEWLVTVRYTEEGYVKDDDKIDAAAMLKAIQDGTEEDNKEREAQGFKALHVKGWAEPPLYQQDVHHLVWALIAEDADGQSVNFNTRVLGRKGYVALNLVTSPGKLATDKPVAAALLAATTFDAGARYQDFDRKNDKVAEYGLAALVAGGAGAAALKLGLFAGAGKWLIALVLAAKKLIVLAVAGAAAFFRKLFRKKEPLQSPPAQNDLPPAT